MDNFDSTTTFLSHRKSKHDMDMSTSSHCFSPYFVVSWLEAPPTQGSTSSSLARQRELSVREARCHAMQALYASPRRRRLLGSAAGRGPFQDLSNFVLGMQDQGFAAGMSSLEGNVPTFGKLNESSTFHWRKHQVAAAVAFQRARRKKIVQSLDSGLTAQTALAQCKRRERKAAAKGAATAFAGPSRAPAAARAPSDAPSAPNARALLQLARQECDRTHEWQQAAMSHLPTPPQTQAEHPPVDPPVIVRLGNLTLRGSCGDAPATHAAPPRLDPAPASHPHTVRPIEGRPQPERLRPPSPDHEEPNVGPPTAGRGCGRGRGAGKENKGNYGEFNPVAAVQTMLQEAEPEISPSRLPPSWSAKPSILSMPVGFGRIDMLVKVKIEAGYYFFRGIFRPYIRNFNPDSPLSI
ncbi:hypothetical protein B0H17DRAFT_1266104 [Mycena rosella]|uniref:Uncharacterized protein n=1 Tax=Mycena rosella TaxID=1033263 RepID=A0AAD7CNU8_MYCRO|nr:hypothetical protein B0H17DRAFT_1266104 [Mycena rosella]